MVSLLMCTLSDDLCTLLLSDWLDVRGLVTLDTAVSSKTCRPRWITLLQSLRFTSIDNLDHNASSLMWLIQRGVRVLRMQMAVDAWQVSRCDLSLLRTVDLL